MCKQAKWYMIVKRSKFRQYEWKEMKDKLSYVLFQIELTIWFGL